MNQLSTKVSAQPDGPIVAVQYPSKVEFESKPGVGKELATKYGHLKQLDVEDKSGYKELKAAIASVKTLRTDTTKQENTIKGPLNTFRQLVIDAAKAIRSEIQPVEDALTDEKQRIDDIKADRLAAQQKLWNDNLQIIRSRGQSLFGATIEQLQNELDIISSCNLDNFDFGEYIEDARAELANARIRTEQAIEQEKQRLKLKEQQEAMAKAEADRQANEAKAKLIADEEAAYAEAETRELKAKIAAMEEASKPAVKDMPDNDFQSAMDIPAVDSKPEPEAVQVPSDFDAPAPTLLIPSDEDRQKMEDVCLKIEMLVDLLPVDFENQSCVKAVNRIVDTLNKMPNYLKSVAAGGDA